MRLLTVLLLLALCAYAQIPNLPNDTTASGDIIFTNIASPSTPASGKTKTWADATGKLWCAKNDAGTLSCTAFTLANVSHKWLNSFNASTGTFTQTQPDYSDLTGTPTIPSVPITVTNGGSGISNTGANGKLLIGDGSGHFVEGDPLVQGTQAAGSVTQPSPVTGGGWDGTNVRTLKTDANGVLQVNLTSGGLSNPMTTAGDIIYAASAGVPTRLPAGTATQLLHGGTVESWSSVAQADVTNGFIDLSTNQSVAGIKTFTTLLSKYWGGAPVFDATQYAGADACAKVAAVIADTAFTALTRAVVDATGFVGNQNCASTWGPTTIPTKIVWGEVNLHITAAQNPNGNLVTIPAPSAPTATPSATGGSLLTATAYGIKVTYVSLNGESLPSSETSSTTPTCGGNVCSDVITSPVASFAATCYNVYSATPVGSGWKLNNTTGCIPLGINYTIKTVGAGAVPPVASTTSEGLFEIAGLGESTIFSLEGASATIAAVNLNNFYYHDFKVTSSAAAVNNANMWIGNAQNGVITNVTLAGGGHQLLINSNSKNIDVHNIRMAPPTIANTSGIYVQTGSTDIHFWNIKEVLPGIWPTGTYNGPMYLQNCDRCTVDGLYVKNQDATNQTNSGGLILSGGTGLNISNVDCDTIQNMDCIAVTGFAKDITISDSIARNIDLVTGVGANINNGDCLDIFYSSQITVNNFIGENCSNSSQPTGQKLPGIEIYESPEVHLNNVQILNGGNYGLSSYGSPGFRMSNSNFSRSADSGLLFQDWGAQVSCNGTSTVTLVSGSNFGPWLAWTPILINSIQHYVLAVASTSSLTLQDTCITGNPLTAALYTTDLLISGSNFDDNGRAPIGGAHAASHCSGIELTGHTQATITGGSASDSNPTIASKTQCWAVNIQNNARGVIDLMSTGGPTGNWGAAGAGGDFNDAVGNSPIWKEDNATKRFILDATSITPKLVATTDIGTTALPFANLWLGTAATNNFKFQPAATAAARVISMPDPLGAVNMPYVIASGTSAMTTAAIVGGACGTTVTTAATGALTTDSIEVARNAAVTAANGGLLQLNSWVTAGNVNFNYCNGGTVSNTPTAMTINWRVIR